MNEAVFSARLSRDDMCALATLLAHTSEGVELAYRILDDVVARHGLDDAHLVLRPELLGPQIFRRSRLAVATEAVADLLSRPIGLYTVPDVVEPATRTALARICNVALTASAARLHAAMGPTSNLAGRAAIQAALARAVARSARYGWACTAVLLTTTGEESSADRWTALCRALRQALRTGDEAGVAGAGRAMAILADTGSDVVRPFVARVRAALTAAGADGIDLMASTASAPDETVDPAELWALASERLNEICGPAPGDTVADVSALELELRALPGVLGVGTAPRSADGMLTVTVVVDAGSDTNAERVAQLVSERVAHANATVVTSAPQMPGGTGPVPATGPILLANGHRNRAEGAGSASAQLSANAPRVAQGTDRVNLLSASFDPDSGVSEVHLGRDAARGTGRASAGPLAGGAQATLTALADLGTDVPFYLISAERVRSIPGEPVAVVLTPRRSQGDAPRAPLGERIGVATGREDVEAAARATLGALNRLLAPMASQSAPGEPHK